MKLRKDSLVFGLFMTIVLPAAWSAPLPFGALGEEKPAKEVDKSSKPKSVPAASGRAKAISSVSERGPQAVAPSAPSVPALAKTYRVGHELKDCDVCPVLVVLPKGEFMMGSPSSEPERDSSEGPAHRVKIEYGLAVGKYEVSQREWQAVMGSNPSLFKGEDLPVESVGWEEARAYIKKLNARTGNKYGYRLLSESEWEYAARAGTSTPFNTGQTISVSQANFDGDYTYNGSGKGERREKTTRVGNFGANAWGLYDMHGNVLEWVEDCWRGDYVGAPSDGSARVTSCKGRRVMRGGSWDNGPSGLRSANRFVNPPGIEFIISGFRLARTL